MNLFRRVRIPAACAAISGIVGLGYTIGCHQGADDEELCGTTPDNVALCRSERVLGVGTRRGVLAAVGNTPLIELESLSAATGCRILAKCEHLNPGGSVKDRAALWMVERAEKEGLLDPSRGGTIYEGTGGNTGVGLAMVAASKGYSAVMAMPKTIASEKIEAIQNFGAKAILTPPVAFDSSEHYYHRARREAEKDPAAFWANQFDNLANMLSHFEGTAPELWSQAEENFGLRVDAFVCAAGTGGTIAGCSAYLKLVNPACKCLLIDPHGSALFDYIEGGKKEVEPVKVHGIPTRFIPRSVGSSIAEGIGIGRLTGNFRKSARFIDGALQGTDEEVVAMSYYLKEVEGVYVGPSAALNVVGAVKLAKALGPGKTVVTILCDGGGRYKSKLYTKSWLEERGLSVPEDITKTYWTGAEI